MKEDRLLDAFSFYEKLLDFSFSSPHRRGLVFSPDDNVCEQRVKDVNVRYL
jgi:hypothetical protein